MINERMRQLAGINEAERHVFSRRYIDIEKNIRSKADKLGCSIKVSISLDKLTQMVEKDSEFESDCISEHLKPLEKALDNLEQALKI